MRGKNKCQVKGNRIILNIYKSLLNFTREVAAGTETISANDRDELKKIYNDLVFDCDDVSYASFFLLNTS